MSSFMQDMIDELTTFVRSSQVGVDYDFSKDDREANFMWDISFSHFEVPFSDIRYFVISWYDDDDLTKDYEHKAAFYFHRDNEQRTLGGIESALFTMLGRYSCDTYVHQIANALYIDTSPM